jgi:hypothetical protein
VLLKGEVCRGRLSLLDTEQDLAVLPEFFEVIEVALLGGEQVENNISVIHDHPTIPWITLLTAALTVFGPHTVHCPIRQRVKHAVARAGADHKIVGEGRYILDIEQENILTFFVFEQVYDRMS